MRIRVFCIKSRLVLVRIMLSVGQSVWVFVADAMFPSFDIK